MSEHDAVSLSGIKLRSGLDATYEFQSSASGELHGKCQMDGRGQPLFGASLLFSFGLQTVW